MIPLTYAMCVEELIKSLRYYRCYRICTYISLRRPDSDIRYTRTESRNMLDRLATGEKLGAFGLTEPGAGTDAQGAADKGCS